MVKYDLPLTFFFLLTKMKNDYPWDVNTHRLILHYFFYLVIFFLICFITHLFLALVTLVQMDATVFAPL